MKMKTKAIKLIQVPASQDETQQTLLLLAIIRLQRRTRCQIILSFLGHESLDEFNLGFLFDVQDNLGLRNRAGVTGLSARGLKQFVGLNLNLQFPYFHLEAIPALGDNVAGDSEAGAQLIMEKSNHG